MRELFLLFGLISLGYFAESSISQALNQSCAIYEHSATTARNRNPSPLVETLPAPADLRIARQRIKQSDYDRAMKVVLQPNVDPLNHTPSAELTEVSISQASPQSRRTIR